MRGLTTAAMAASLALASALARAGDELRPPLVGMSEHFDSEKCVSIELPVNWKEEGPAPNFGAIQRWSGFFQPPKPDGPDAWIEVRDVCAFSRAELAHWGVQPGLIGMVDPLTVLRHGGVIEEVRRDDAKQRFLLFRWIEREGRVYELVAWSHETIYPHIEKHLQRVLGTFKVLKPRDWAKMPAGYTSAQTPASEVWTDTKDKKTLKRVTDLHTSACAALARVLPGERAMPERMRIVVCEKDTDFNEFAKQAIGGGGGASTSYIAFEQRLFVARVGGKSNAQFDDTCVSFAAAQYIQYYFGGKTPDWIDRGLSIWAVTAVKTKGHPEKPPPEYVRNAKSAVAARSEEFAAVLDARRENEASSTFEQFDMSRYAWNCFFLFGAGQMAYGERYAKYVDTLRATGSPDEAKKAFEGVDLVAITKAFQAWAASWK